VYNSESDWCVELRQERVLGGIELGDVLAAQALDDAGADHLRIAHGAQGFGFVAWIAKLARSGTRSSGSNNRVRLWSQSSTRAVTSHRRSSRSGRLSAESVAAEPRHRHRDRGLFFQQRFLAIGAALGRIRRSSPCRAGDRAGRTVGR
jgi:hypothetical protein